MFGKETPMAEMKRQLPELPPAAFAKQEESDDTDFYVPVRLVSHIDEAATQALSAYYRAVLPAGGVFST